MIRESTAVIRPSKIKAIQLSMLTEEEIRAMAVVEVTRQQLFHSNNYVPVRGGLFSPEMGNVDPCVNFVCPTDGLLQDKCPGYFGYIELVKPVPWFQHAKRIRSTLKMVCYRCSKLLIPENANQIRVLHAMEIGERLKRIQRVRTNTCPSCKTIQPKKIDEITCAEDILGACNLMPLTGDESISPEAVSALTLALRKKDRRDRNMVLYVLNFGDDRKLVLDFENIYSLLSKMNPADAILLGFDMNFAKPRAMGCKALPVSPPAVRPSVRPENGQRSEDDQTSIYHSIIRTNDELKELLSTYGTMVNTAIELRREMVYSIYDKWSYLAFLVASLYTSKIPGYTPLQQRTGRPFTNVKSRTDSKQGRFRGNINGKRTSLCARTVIIGGPLNKANETTIPKEFAMGLTIKEFVTYGNMEFLQKLVDNGPNVYPGARHVAYKEEGYIMKAILPPVKTSDGQLIRRQYMRRIQPGDKVYRHLLEGDPVLTNRQPSLTKNSIQGNKIRVAKYGSAMHISLMVVAPYNADFDGDEMNLHVSQTSMARSEAVFPNGVAHHIISPTNATPVISPHQDSILGGYVLTEPGKTVSVRQAMAIVQHVFCNSYTDLFRNPEDPTGKSLLPLNARIDTRKLISLVFPRTFQFEMNGGGGNGGVKIVDGQLVSGRLKKSVLNASTRGIIHRLFNDYGSFTCLSVINQIHDIMREFMMTHSFSLSSSDFVCKDEARRKIDDLIAETMKESETLIRQVYNREFKNNTLETSHDKFEIEINNILNRLNFKVGQAIAETLDDTHNIKTTINSESKGNLANNVQMLAMFGQQNVEGMRIPMDRLGVVLPYYQKYELAPEARGFIRKSYTQGLNPLHQIHTGNGGRQLTVLASTKTSKSGYMQRRLVKSMEAMKVCYDFTVRYSGKRITQFAFGDNHVNTEKLESVPLEFISKSQAQLLEYFLFIPDALSKRINKDHVAKFESLQLESANYILETRNEYLQLLCAIDCGNDRFVTQGPVAFAQLLTSYRCHDRTHQRANHQSIDLLSLQSAVLQGYRSYFDESKIRWATPGRLFKACFLYFLNPLILALKGFTVEETETLVRKIQLIYLKALVPPGKCVGVIAGQSCAAANTQSALDASKKANGESKSSMYRVTGMARLEELLVLKQDPGSPFMTIYPSYINTADPMEHKLAMEDLKVSLKYCILHDLVKECSIVYAPYSNELVAKIQEREAQDPFDSFLMYRYSSYSRNMRTTNGAMLQQHNLFPWVLRIVLDEEQMFRHKVTVQEVVCILKRVYNENIDCVYSTMTDSQLVMRVALQNSFMLKRCGVNKKDASSLSMSIVLETLQSFQKSLLRNTVIKGIEKVVDVSIRDTNVWEYVNGDFRQVNTQILETTGSNLLKVLTMKGVDATRTYSNHIYEVYMVLGKLACRALLIQEMKKVLPSTNFTNICSVVDKILYLATPCVVNRSGIRNDKVSMITKASFETQTECMIQGSRRASFNEIDSPTMSVLTAQKGKFGTNICTVRVDITHPLITKAWSQIRSVAERKMQQQQLLQQQKEENNEKDVTFPSSSIPMDDEESEENLLGPTFNRATISSRSMIENVFLNAAITNDQQSVAMEIEMD